MSHMSISCQEKPKGEALLSVRTVTLREKILTALLGSKVRFMIIVPGEAVDEIEIRKGGDAYEPDE